MNLKLEIPDRSRPDGNLQSRQTTIAQLTEAVGDEWMDWYRMTPAERWQASGQLWETYLALGGSLDPEPDTQSPFYILPS